MIVTLIWQEKIRNNGYYVLVTHENIAGGTNVPAERSSYIYRQKEV